MAVAKRERNSPGHLWPRNDVFIAAPRDVVGGIADPEYGVEKELHTAGPRPDHHIRAGYGSSEAVSRPAAHLFDTQKQHNADRDREDRQQNRDPAVAEGLQGETGDDHLLLPPGFESVRMSANSTTLVKCRARRRS